MSKTQEGYFLIADITGYTVYLHESELEHAQETLQSLLEVLIAHTKPPLIISRLAGDAVISYGLRGNFFRGQTFIEMIEDTYVAFRKAINLMVLNNSCQCNACANVSSLDLKFFVHYGSFGIQRLSQHDELVGNDVNLIHRLLKNHVTEESGIRAYTLYTDVAVRQLGIEEISATMLRHVEVYEHLGEVQTWIQDMHPVWQQKREQTLIKIDPKDRMAYETAEVPLSPEVMWDIVTDPSYRSILIRSERQKILNRQGGRLAPGSIYQCFHGDGRVTTQTILEWQPFRQITTEDVTPFPNSTVLVSIHLTPTSQGTRVEYMASKLRGPWFARLVGNMVGRFMVRSLIRDGLLEFAERLEREMAEGKFALTPTDMQGNELLLEQ